MALTLPVQSLQSLTSKSGSLPIEATSALNGEQALTARIQSVTQDQTNPALFRIRVALQTGLMELLTSRPLEPGREISISRNGNGDLQLQLQPQSNSANNASATTGRANETSAAQANQSRSSTTLQLSLRSANTGVLEQTLPLNTTLTARVIPNATGNGATIVSSTPTTAAQNTAPAQGQISQGQTAPVISSPTTATPPSGQPVAAASPTSSTQQSPASTSGATTQTSAPAAGGNLSGSTATIANQVSNQVQNQATTQVSTPTPPTNNQKPSITAAPTQNSATSQTTSTSPNIATPAVSASTNNTSAASTAQTAIPPASSPANNNVSAATASPNPSQILTSTTGVQATAHPVSVNVTTPSTASQPTTPASQAATAQATPPTTGSTPTNQIPTNTSIPQPANANSGSQSSMTSSASVTAPPSTQTAQTTPPPQPAKITTPATATSPTTSPIDNLVTLNVNGQRIELSTPRPLQPGMTVELTRRADNRIELNILPPRPGVQQMNRLNNQLHSVLRETLPTQIPLGDAIGQLRQFQTQNSSSNDAVGKVVQSLLGLFGVKSQASAASNIPVIQRNMMAQGLGSASSPDANTLSRSLTQLGELARQLPEEGQQKLLQLLDGMRSRSTSQQVSSLQHWQNHPDGSIERQYRFDLPVWQQDGKLSNAEIQIDEQRHNDNNGELVTHWSVNLHFDLDALGSLDTRLNLKPNNELDARFWAERYATSELIRDQLGDFNDTLTEQGFSVGHLRVQQGEAPKTEQPINHRLVDIHT